MFDDRVEVCVGCETGFDGPHEAVEATKAIELFAVAQFCGIERGAQEGYRFVVGLEWDRKRMTVFTPSANEKRAGSLKRLGAPWTTSATSASD